MPHGTTNVAVADDADGLATEIGRHARAVGERLATALGATHVTIPHSDLATAAK